ncbi:MAG: pentapeptide repeat-containing protein, partial [Crocosphaera sp.]|nr:pentapeptide repeat-containing protein [Crocosphaera sp.]
ITNFSLTYSAIRATNFYNANLTNANCKKANLKNTNFSEARLTRTCFKDTVKLNLARPGNTLLANPDVRDLLVNPSSGEGKDFSQVNLRGAYLKEANLQRANLKYADISEATLEYANLSHANLTEINAVKTNFTKVSLTGACIENWNIDATTKLDNIDCQYVYLLNNEKERQPSSGEFKPGEFTKLFEEVFDTVNLIFENGIDWKAFIETLKTVQVENEDTPLEVASIEHKGDGVFVVKVKVPPDTNKEKIHQEFNEIYQLKLETVEAKYKAMLDAKETEITIYRQQSIDMMEIVKTQASRPIHVEAKAMNNSSDSSKNINIRDINNSGVLNLGEIIGDVNNTINQIPENEDNKNDELKTLLQELIQAIKSENELDEDEKAEAANKVKTIAQASQKPEDEGLQKKASRAVKLLETLAKGLEPATKLATACKIILPKIITFLGLSI